MGEVVVDWGFTWFSSKKVILKKKAPREKAEKLSSKGIELAILGSGAIPSPGREWREDGGEFWSA